LLSSEYILAMVLNFGTNLSVMKTDLDLSVESFEHLIAHWPSRRHNMAPRHGKEFRKEAVRLALSSGLTRKQVADDLGVGFSTLNRWVQKDQDDALMSGPHTDLETENIRLRKEVRILREEREILKKAAIFFASQK